MPPSRAKFLMRIKFEFATFVDDECCNNMENLVLQVKLAQTLH